MNILTINSGSSSLKASLFKADGSRRNFRYEHIGHGFPHDHAEAFDALLRDLGEDRPAAVGHRFVHGGAITDAARPIDAQERARLESITHLAPLHMPGNLLGVDLCVKHFDVPQVACFDTAFHATLQEIAWRLPELIGEAALGRVVVAHLGNGASLCLMENLKSVDTSMGYTPAAGIPMGTRSGDLDPGVMLELAKRLDATQLSDLVYHHMGLLALSEGESNEMSDLLASHSQAARFAVDYYARQVRAAIGAYAAKAGGIDALVFTGGIGEHADKVRALVCEPLGFLGFELDAEANRVHSTWLNTSSSKPVLMIAADEEDEIARLTAVYLDAR